MRKVPDNVGDAGADHAGASDSGETAVARAEGASAGGPLATLFGDPARLSVERAVGELRSGRPVSLDSSDRALVVAAAETLGGDAIIRWQRVSQAPVGLVLPQPRLAYLGLDADAPGRVALDGLSADMVDDILFSAAPALPPLRHRPATAGESLALALIKHAYLLPAAVVLPHAETACAPAFRVTADAVATYHDRAARQLQVATRTQVPLAEAVDAEFVVFRGGDGQRDQVAIVVGDPQRSAKPVPVRLHSACLTGDLFGSLKCDCGDQLRGAIEVLAESGGGVLLYLDQEGRGIGLRNKMRAYSLQNLGHDTLEADAALGYGADERRYSIAGRMLALLGIGRIVLLTNSPAKIAALEQEGVRVVDHQRVLGRVNGHNRRYLQTKARAGHLLGDLGDEMGGG